MAGFFVSVLLPVMKFPSIKEIYSLFRENPVIATDSRTIPPGSVFFALKGEKFNGNQFAESALQQGCSYAVIDEQQYYKGENYILVKDVLACMQELAKYHRKKLKIPFIAITGSNGKTTTKELIKSILSKKYKALATAGNLNNHIGVPLTLLSITSEIEIAVIEMGANHRREIALLCEIALPDYGLITNIGKAHLGEFGSFEDIVKAKTEMYEFIRRSNGKIFLNADDALLMNLAKDLEKISYGKSKNSFCTCNMLESFPFVKIQFDNTLISSQIIGQYNFENIAAAICLGKYFGIDAKKIKEAVEEYVPSNNRSQILKTNFNTLLLDAYNANPTSMEAAIKNFSETKFLNKMVILGDMMELGKFSKVEHKKILELIHKNDFMSVILVGEEFYKAAKNSTYLLFKNSYAVAEWLKNNPVRNANILIKGSRGIKLEKVIEFL